MANNKCSFCGSEDEDRKYLNTDDGSATICSTCAGMFTTYMQNLNEDEDEDDSSNSQDDMNFDEYKNDAIVAVSNDGLDLENFEELQDDDDVVMAAVKNNGGALQFASERLRADKDIVIAAVKNDPYVIEFASDDLQDDDDVLDACEAEED